MKFYIPADLTDPMIHESEGIPHGETLTIDELARRIDVRRVAWLNAHPGWFYTGTDLVKCADGSPPPAYDVNLGFKRARTPSELEVQARDREAYVAHKEADFAKREAEQKTLLDQVLSSLNP